MERVIRKLSDLFSRKLFLELKCKFSKKVQINKKGKIIIYKKACLKLDKTSKIIINNGHLVLYPCSKVNLFNGSKLIVNKTLHVGLNNMVDGYGFSTINIFGSSTFSSCGGCVYPGASIAIYKNGNLLTKGYCDINYGCLIRVNKNITIGKGCFFGRNTFVTDTDSHKVLKNSVDKSNCKEVVIGDNVWVGANCALLKGTFINDNCVIAAGTVVSGKNIPANSLVISKKPLTIEPIKGWEC